MKYAIIFLFLLGVQAKASDPIVVWLVAPEIWSAQSADVSGNEKNLEAYLSQTVGQPIQVQVKTSSGFALSQYISLKEAMVKEQPAYIFYIEPARFLAKDLEEVLMSKTLPDTPLTNERVSDNDIQEAQSFWSKAMPNAGLFASIKEANFLNYRLKHIWKNQDSPTSEREFFLNISALPLSNIQFLLKDHSHVLFLFSPERIRYSREIFSDGSLKTSLAQTFFHGINVEKDEFKDFVTYSGLNFAFLPGEFYHLSKTENLMAGSNAVLNSTGMQKSFQLIKPMISSYLALEKKKLEEIARVKAAKPATTKQKKAQKKAKH